MGVCWNIVNPAKRQFLDPHHMGWPDKMRGVMNGPPAFATRLLVCASAQWGEAGLAGSWHGDRIFFANDTNDPANCWGVVTEAPHYPERSLFAMAEEFTDISDQALSMMSHATGTGPLTGLHLIVNPAKREYLRPDRMFWPDDGGSPVAGAPALAVSMLVCQAHWGQAPALAGGWRGDAVFIGACWSIWPLSGCNYRPDQGTGRRRHQDKQD